MQIKKQIIKVLLKFYLLGLFLTKKLNFIIESFIWL